MRLLVFGGWFGSRNLGDDAILIGLREIMARTVADAEITAISTDPRYTKEVCGVDAVALQSPRSLLKNRDEYLSNFRDADAVIITGGTPIYDYGYVSRAIHMGLPALQGKPLILFGVGAKPLISPQGRAITKLLLRRASAISVRDMYSKRVLSQLTTHLITVTGDSALFIKQEKTLKLLERPAIVVCPRFLSGNYKAHYHTHLTQTEINVARQMIAHATDSLKERGFNVYLIPFHTERLDNDLLEASRILELTRSRDAALLERPATPGQALNLLSSVDLLIGLRLHSLVLAAVAGTPIASVNYDPKIEGFMQMTYADNYLCGLNSGLDSLTAATLVALDDIEELRNHMLESVRQMRRRILGEAARIRGILRET